MPSFDATLEYARSVLEREARTPAEKQQVAPLITRMNQLLAGNAPQGPVTHASQSADPRQQEVMALRTEIQRLRRFGSQESGLLGAVLNEMPHGILACDANGTLILQNRGSERIWAGSASADDVEGWGQYRAYHPDGRPFEPSDWSMARCLSQNETVEAEEVHFQRFDGSHGILLGSCAPLRDAQGKLLGAVSVFADITQFKMIERLKDQWVALAGDKLRAPLQLLREKLTESAKAMAEQRPVVLPELLPILAKQVDRMQALVNDMLDVSRAQAGNLHVKPVPTPLRPLVTRVCESLVRISPAHALRLDLDEVVAVADPGRIEQVVTNLINNALQFSPGGEIAVRVKEEGAEVAVEIRDQGRGFDPRHAEQLFEPFFQLTRDNHPAAGLGLGLYLCRELVQRMSGRIQAFSEGAGKGATFTFTLPCAQS